MIYVYYITKGLLLAIYINVVLYGWTYFFKPIIALNGVHNVAATWFALVALGTLCGFLWSIIPKPRTPQACYKIDNIADAQAYEYERYLEDHPQPTHKDQSNETSEP